MALSTCTRTDASCFEVRAHIGLVRVTGKVGPTDVADPVGASLRGWSPVL